MTIRTHLITIAEADMITPTPNTYLKLAYRIDEAVKATGLGRSFLYERMAEGTLKSVKIGGRRLILGEDLLAFLKCEYANGCPREVSVKLISVSCVKPSGCEKTKKRSAALSPETQIELPLGNL